MPADEDLLLAFRYMHVAEAKRLLSRRTKAAAVRDHWWLNERTLLHYSCSHGWLDVTKRLVEKYSCDPGISDNEGETPLHEACREGHTDVVMYLVREIGVSAICFNMEGDTPLDLACEHGHQNVVEFLMKWDINTAWLCRQKVALLHQSCLLNVTRALVEDHKYNPESRDKQGRSFFHMACHQGHVDIVKYLVSTCQCSIACQDSKNVDTPLHLACKQRNLCIAEILTTGKDIDTACQYQNQEGKTVLHYCCRNGWLDVTRTLVEKHHCHPDRWVDNDGETPLHKACFEGHMDIVMYLVDCGCDTAHKNYADSNTPMHLACSEKHLDIVEILLTGHGREMASVSQNASKKAPIHYSCRNGWFDITKRLVEQYDCDPDVRDCEGATPLHEACCKGQVDIVRYLVSECACSISYQNSLGNTPLHLAVYIQGQMSMAEILLSGFDCSTAGKCKNKDGKTPLHYCCRNGWLRVTRTLVEQHGCDPDSRDRWNNTPLHEACRMDRTDVVQFLLSTGRVDPWCRNTSNQTPLQLSKDYMHNCKIVQ